MDENAHHENNLHTVRNTSFQKIPTEFSFFFLVKKTGLYLKTNVSELLSTHNKQERISGHSILHFEVIIGENKQASTEYEKNVLHY